MPPSIPSNLGNKVTTRTTSWQDLVEKAWGSEFRAPDHDIYRFGGGARNYDSTDKGLTGLYGVHGDNLLYINNKYPDMRDGVLVNQDGVTPLGALNNGFGTYVDVNADVLDSTSAASNAPAVVETDPNFANVQLLSFPSSLTPTDQSQNAFPLTIVNAPVIAVSDGAMGSQFAYAPNNNSSSRIYTPSSAVFIRPANMPYTLEFSVKVLAPVVGTQWLMTYTAGTYIQISASAGNTWSLDCTGWGVTSVASLLPLNVWHNVAICYDGTVSRGFINGVLRATNTPTTSATLTNTAFGVINIPGINTLGATGLLMNNVRVTWGFSRYGAVYNVRTTPFPTSGP